MAKAQNKQAQKKVESEGVEQSTPSLAESADQNEAASSNEHNSEAGGSEEKTDPLANQAQESVQLNQTHPKFSKFKKG